MTPGTFGFVISSARSWMCAQWRLINVIGWSMIIIIMTFAERFLRYVFYNIPIKYAKKSRRGLINKKSAMRKLKCVLNIT